MFSPNIVPGVKRATHSRGAGDRVGLDRAIHMGGRAGDFSLTPHSSFPATFRPASPLVQEQNQGQQMDRDVWVSGPEPVPTEPSLGQQSSAPARPCPSASCSHKGQERQARGSCRIWCQPAAGPQPDFRSSGKAPAPPPAIPRTQEQAPSLETIGGEGMTSRKGS